MTSPLDEKAIMCGGCGETDPNKRCIGCRHEFHPRPYAAPALAVSQPIGDGMGVVAEAHFDEECELCINPSEDAIERIDPIPGESWPLVRLSEARALIAAKDARIEELTRERDELLYLHSERDQGDKIINERLSALEDGVKAVVTERDIWRRVAERLEGEKQAAEAQVAALRAALEKAKSLLVGPGNIAFNMKQTAIHTSDRENYRRISEGIDEACAALSTAKGETE